MVNIFTDSVTKTVKTIILFILEVIIFLDLNNLFDIIGIIDFKTAFLIILTVSVINAILWPIISYFSLNFFVLTFGIGTFIIDGIILLILSYFIHGFIMEPADFITAPLLIGIINSGLAIILNFDNEEIYYRNIIRKRFDKSDDEQPDKRGFIFLEIDGLAYDVLVDAIKNDDMPTVKSMLEDDSHHLIKWETDLSSQTSSSQAGILHGNNNDIPAFRWVEKDNNNKIVSSNGFGDSGLIEERISNHHGLLSENGGSRCNLFTGDAPDFILTLSKLSDRHVLHTKTWYYLFSEPYFIARVISLMLWDILVEIFSRIYHRLKNINPRLKRRGLKYFIARFGANVIMREAATSAIIGDVLDGEYDKVYTTYMGYDEIAHHSGIRDPDAFYALRQIDKQFSNIKRVIDSANRKYELIILSDHGQSVGPTFKMKYKLTLEDLVRTYLPEHTKIHSILYSNNDHIFDNVSLSTHLKQNRNRIKEEHEKLREVAEILRNKKDRLLDRKFFNEAEPMINKIEDIANSMGFDIDLTHDDVVDIDEVETIVLASGNLGLIYFTQWNKRLTYEKINDAFPGLIRGLASHPGIGFIMVKSSVYGTLVFNDDNIYYLDDDYYKYPNDRFLDKYGDNIADHLRRTDSFKHVPDILVNSTYNVDDDQVYAFENLIGSHGGAGGTQQYPFIFAPKSWNPSKPIIGAENVHKFFKNEMNKIWDEEEKLKENK
ncbi:phage holin family protein [Methanosphaera cuniculi]|uniref:Type I phosphodiesterase / nucleotide pyrophosphatase n=1 Tax=Methanosphaera cuniculi TaxID=1077256 RepID=A0A2A2HFE4_9EURY|nr:phage holin family protein [Methanosphaera cuniculi]PAV08191.1 hypothetical protein ASJ82_03075 [Methanosphaera cuniculi]PWL08275.1 membrane protein of unknown function [Methanosphaera cuniculi]